MPLESKRRKVRWGDGSIMSMSCLEQVEVLVGGNRNRSRRFMCMDQTRRYLFITDAGPLLVPLRFFHKG